MQKTVVINVVGLTMGLIGKHTPFLQSFVKRGAGIPIKPMLPGVTCSVQSTYLTGKTPSEHGIVGNGWYFDEECEVKFWRQSNKLVESQKIWEKLKVDHPDFKVSNMFWWYNMYSTADFSLTPRPNYLADGRKIPDIYSHPAELRDTLQKKLGTFPLFSFWGPKTNIKSTQWIADASIATDELHNPNLTLIYLPHLDYNLQRYGIDFDKIGKDLKEVDAEVQKLCSYYEKQQARVVILSEYGITNVKRPIHLNRALRQENLIQIREERGLELLDAGASKAFAVADHQVAHVYLNDKSLLESVKSLLQQQEGVEHVLIADKIKEHGLDHERCGDLVVVADKDSWFTYYFWEDDAKAPDYARMVDIHKKPGYDPVELFTDPKDPLVVPKILWKLLRKKLGFRTVLDVIPIRAELVKGSHGRIPELEQDYPVLLSNSPELVPEKLIEATVVYSILEKHIRK